MALIEVSAYCWGTQFAGVMAAGELLISTSHDGTLSGKSMHRELELTVGRVCVCARARNVFVVCLFVCPSVCCLLAALLLCCFSALLVCWFACWLAGLLVRSFARSFVRLVVRLFVRLCVCQTGSFHKEESMLESGQIQTASNYFSLGSTASVRATLVRACVTLIVIMF